jgi:hypothetical protein
MQAILFTNWACAPEGHTTLHFKAGDVLTGRAAELAMDAGVAFNPVEETKIEAPLERKKRVRK